MIELLLIVGVGLCFYSWGRARITRRAAVAFGVEITFLLRAVRARTAEMATAPALENAKQTARHQRWAQELERACYLAETYYHLSIKLGTTSQWEKEHGAGTRQDIRVRGDLPPAEEVEGRGSEEV